MDKTNILQESKTAVARAGSLIQEAMTAVDSWLATALARRSRSYGADRIVGGQLIEFNQARLEELGYLKDSPFFVRCDILMDGKELPDSLYFGKFGFSEAEIYSWVVPASSIRFEAPGPVSYVRPDGVIQEGRLLRKDQYMIAQGEIKFLATESIGFPRTLVYQDQFSNRKTGFVLPEIVAQMEKAQDQVIRAYHIGPMLISGPAGSGKTTLALHRVAYLLQSPDLAADFSSETTLVMVQDNGTKEYFSALLPGLGINNVAISTFSDWALAILNLQVNYAIRGGDDSQFGDVYEYAKLAALRGGEVRGEGHDKPFEFLANFYKPYFSSAQQDIFSQQIKDNILDKVDLTILLQACLQKNGSLGGQRQFYEELPDGSVKKRIAFISLNYSLAIIDEFQNYLPEQLRLIKSSVSGTTESVVYVGDMAQQVQLGTIQNFADMGEVINTERQVILQKVYRNTRRILEYIGILGYRVDIPDGIKEGAPVIEHLAMDAPAEISIIKGVMEDKSDVSVGILAKDRDWLAAHRQAFENDKNIHVMSMAEAQGVEFDVVFLVGINEKSFVLEVKTGTPLQLTQEKRKINRDLLYVALTRAISELHILGESGIKLSQD